MRLSYRILLKLYMVSFFCVSLYAKTADYSKQDFSTKTPTKSSQNIASITLDGNSKPNISTNKNQPPKDEKAHRNLLFNLRAGESGGGWSSSGGTIINVPGTKNKYILIDLFLNNQNYEDDFNQDDILQESHQQISSLEVTALKSFQRLQARLELWKEQYPDLIYLIRETLKYTHFYYTRKIAPDNGDYKLPEYLKSKYPKAITKKVAFYSYLNNDFGYGVTISSRAWNQTGENSKAGIILQEVLRQIQIAYKDNMSDGTLEKFTAMIMLSDPEDCRIENLEFGNFMSDIVQYPDNELRRQLIGLCKKFEDKYEYLDECYIQSDIALNDFSKVANRVTALIPEYLDSSYMSIRDEFVSLYLKGMKASLRKTHPSWYDLKQHY